MRKNHVLFIFLTLLLALTFIKGSPVEANNDIDERNLDISSESYEELIQNGILSNDIDYESWIKIKKQAKDEESIYLEKNKAHLEEYKSSLYIL